MLVLGIETSCDETGFAIYDSEKGLLAHSLHSQIEIHAAYGGVMPELASRDHSQKLLPLLEAVLDKAAISIEQINGIAYTKGPGLAGALMVGAMFARTLGYALDIPTVGIHHLEGHLLAAFLESKSPKFPFLSLLVSGSHTEIVKVIERGKYIIIGDTLDDAVGEAFDKTARLLGLSYPGGAALAKLAEKGQAGCYRFPRPMLNRPGLDFSFSGLKTFALNVVEREKKLHSELPEKVKANIAYAFQESVVETLTKKCQRALKETKFSSLVVAGGVGANTQLRQSLNEMCRKLNVELFYPKLEFCTDNGAMIAYAGCMRLINGESDDLSVDVKPRWPLNES